MNTKLRLLAVPTLALGALALSATPSFAHGPDSWSGQATLNSMNNSGTTGQAMVEVHGTEAKVTVNVTGAAETFMDGPFPHAQHIHIAPARTRIPTATAWSTPPRGIPSTVTSAPR